MLGGMLDPPDVGQRAQIGLLAVLLLAACGAPGCSRPDDSVLPVRVAGRPPAAETAAVAIDGLQRQVLVPPRATYVLRLDAPPDRPVLELSAGRKSAEPAGTVRFEATLERPDGAPVQLYARDATAPGWMDARVDLGSHRLDGARLVLRTTVVDGPAEVLDTAAWAEPLVLSAARPPAPSAILVSVDSLRADRVGVYGDGASLTPVLDALAREGGWWAQAYASSTWTVPSHTSLLFGLTFATLFHNCRWSCEPLVPVNVRPLPQLLREAGYLTAGFTGGGYVAPRFGFGRGFDLYYGFGGGSTAAKGCEPDRFDGPEVVARTTDWLRRFGQSPFFLFVHTYDVHDECPVRPKEFQDGVTAWADPGPEGRRRFIDYYEQLVGRLDTLLGGLVATLDELGLRDTTLVAVTSDHGQAFWEHGFQGHGCGLKPYEELARVPLLLRFPAAGWRPGRVATPVSTVDLAPTILRGLGQPVPSWIEGGPLPGLGLAPDQARTIQVQCGEFFAFRAGRHKLITSLTESFPDEVYDLDADAGETHDLAGAGHAAERELKALTGDFLRRTMGKEPPAPVGELDDATRARLRALGYVDGAPPAPAGPGDATR